MAVNKVILIGNVTKDPEIRSMTNGKEVASFSLATNERWKNKQGEKQEKVEYHNVVIFSSGLISLAKNYIKKGTKLYIEGKIQSRSWEDKMGQKRKTFEIVLQGYNCTLQILSPKKQTVADSSSPSLKQESQQSSEEDLKDDDIPF